MNNAVMAEQLREWANQLDESTPRPRLVSRGIAAGMRDVANDIEDTSSPVLSIERSDVADLMESFWGPDEATKEEVDLACHWVEKDFDYTHVFESIENIIRFRMPISA